jgi:hypothetical protein
LKIAGERRSIGTPLAAILMMRIAGKVASIGTLPDAILMPSEGS